MITVKYGPANSTTVPAGLSVEEITDKVSEFWGIDGDLTAHCPQGQTLEPNFIPEDGAEISLRNSTPASKG